MNAGSAHCQMELCQKLCLSPVTTLPNWSLCTTTFITMLNIKQNINSHIFVNWSVHDNISFFSLNRIQLDNSISVLLRIWITYFLFFSFSIPSSRSVSLFLLFYPTFAQYHLGKWSMALFLFVLFCLRPLIVCYKLKAFCRQ